jgi:hypothetical protein
MTAVLNYLVRGLIINNHLALEKYDNLVITMNIDGFYSLKMMMIVLRMIREFYFSK